RADSSSWRSSSVMFRWPRLWLWLRCRLFLCVGFLGFAAILHGAGRLRALVERICRVAIVFQLELPDTHDVEINRIGIRLPCGCLLHLTDGVCEILPAEIDQAQCAVGLRLGRRLGLGELIIGGAIGLRHCGEIFESLLLV